MASEPCPPPRGIAVANYQIEIYHYDILAHRVSTLDVKTLCLGALCITDATGYDIKKLFESAFSHFQHASYGSIYPALRQLEDTGLVSSREEPGTGHPARKVFTPTPAGRQRFVETLMETPASEQLRSDFLVLLFFAHLLPTDALAAKLDEVEAQYRQQLDYLESIATDHTHTTGIQFTIDLGIRVYREKLAFLNERRDLLLATHAETPAQWLENDA